MAELPQLSPLPHSMNIVQDEVKTLSITATSTDGGTLSYKWYVNNINNWSGADEITTSTTNVLYIPTTVTGTKYYYCIVTNTKNGSAVAVNSTIAEVNVKSASDYLVSLLNNKTLLVQELNAKGVAADVSETYDTLIPKVNQIIARLPIASTTTLGGIKVGNNLTIDSDGVLSAHDSYSLPTASGSVLGGIKVGENLVIDGNGVLSAVASGDGSNIIECTKNEYMAWEQAGTLEEDTLYVITDIGFNMEEVAAQAHTHSNKGVLDTVTASVVNNSHTHTNKSLLDNLSSTGNSNDFLAADGQYHAVDLSEYISSDVNNTTAVINIRVLTESQFNAITTKDPNTLYYIRED